MNDPPVTPRLLKPWSLFFRLLLIVFISETLVMYLLDFFQVGMPPYVYNLLDPLGLSVLGAPFIWWLVVRPFQQLASAEKSRSDQTLGHIVDAVINFDENGSIQSINPAAAGVFGYTAQEIVGRDIDCIIPRDFIGRFIRRGCCR